MRKDKKEKRGGPVNHLAVWLVDRRAGWAGQEAGRGWGRRLMPGKRCADRTRKIQKLFAELYGGSQAAQQYRAYQIRKTEKLLLTAGVGLTMSLLLTIAGREAKQERVDSLARPGSGQVSRIYDLQAQAGEEQVTISVEVPARELTQKECTALLEQAAAGLQDKILQDNASAEEVREDLTLPQTACDGMVEISWESSDYDVIDVDGQVKNDLWKTEEKLVTLSARMSCGAWEETVSFPVKVLPKQLNLQESLQREVNRSLTEASDREKQELTWKLPGRLGEQDIFWYASSPNYGLWIFLLTAAGCLCLHFSFEQDLEKEAERRREALLQAYPGFLARLTMFAGTGMPIRNVFLRLARQADREADPVHIELVRTCREMESGVTQAEAFENFGRRCRLPQYKKCAAILEQNVRKGSDGLLETLLAEAENAFEERKGRARRKGEEAQTKLLLPMVMMLVIVMILVMVPVCFSFVGM